jgi:hypothetical protein
MQPLAVSSQPDGRRLRSFTSPQRQKIDQCAWFRLETRTSHLAAESELTFKTVESSVRQCCEYTYGGYTAGAGAGALRGNDSIELLEVTALSP